MNIYYARTDHRGVFCVSQCAGLHNSIEVIAERASAYPATIYFVVVVLPFPVSPDHPARGWLS